MIHVMSHRFSADFGNFSTGVRVTASVQRGKRYCLSRRGVLGHFGIVRGIISTCQHHGLAIVDSAGISSNIEAAYSDLICTKLRPTFCYSSV